MKIKRRKIKKNDTTVYLGTNFEKSIIFWGPQFKQTTTQKLNPKNIRTLTLTDGKIWWRKMMEKTDNYKN